MYSTHVSSCACWPVLVFSEYSLLLSNAPSPLLPSSSLIHLTPLLPSEEYTPPSTPKVAVRCHASKAQPVVTNNLGKLRGPFLTSCEFATIAHSHLYIIHTIYLLPISSIHLLRMQHLHVQPKINYKVQFIRGRLGLWMVFINSNILNSTQDN